MPLEQQAPQLDTRNYDQIRRALLARIPRYLPEWTDYNESDPGITLLELFAWLSEQLLFEMNRVPDRAYIKFLKLLGQELGAAIPSTVYLTCTALPNVTSSSVPPDAQFGAQSAEGDMIIFEASEGVDLIRLPLSDVQVFDGAAFSVVSDANAKAGTSFRPFGWGAQVGSALYLGFKQEKADTPAPFPQRISWRVFLPLETAERRVVRSDKVQNAPVPPVNLIWEYRPADAPDTWRALQAFDDSSAAFTREGSIKIQGPQDAIASKEGRVKDQCFWLRVRIANMNYPNGRAPLIDFIRPNIVMLRSLATMREETLGTSTGLPDQLFLLQRRPVQPDSLILDIEGPEPDREISHWQRKDDFLASGRDDLHYVLNASAGEVRFGDGSTGLIPVAGSQIIARQYRYGGGLRANVAANTIIPLSTLSNVASASNERPAIGGNDEEQLNAFLKNAPARLCHRNRAVTADDYATLAREVGGVGKTIALAQFHPDYPGVEVPGAVTVVVVPETDDPAPRPSAELLEAICRYLEPLRTLGAELYVIEPEYIAISVEAVVAVEPYASFNSVRQDIVQAINADLDPLGRGQPGSGAQTNAASGSSGRDFGLDLFPTRLFSVIQHVKHVKSVNYLAVNGQGGVALNKAIQVPRNGLVYGVKNHDITIVPYQENDRA